MSAPASSSSQLILRPGAAETRVLREGADVILEIPMPWLAGPRGEVLATGRILLETEGIILLESPEGLAGVAWDTTEAAPQHAARTLYTDMLTRLGGMPLYRVWNYIPGINDEAKGLENYRAFNAGRHEAFCAAYGREFAARLPAASALGTAGGRMALCFLAGNAPARHFENPEQVPAFQYPPEHGPTPPSFARGTAVSHTGGRSWYLSGTASIKGHETCGSDFAEQARLTFDNVRLMARRMDLPATAAGPWKIFLRHRPDLPACQAALAAAFPEAVHDAMFLEADICRRSLLLEVEATFHQPAAPSPGDSTENSMAHSPSPTPSATSGNSVIHSL